MRTITAWAWHRKDPWTVLVDDEDYDALVRYRWSVYVKDRCAYAVRHIRPAGTIRMHRVILGLAPDDPRQTDHIHHRELSERIIDNR